MSLKPYWVKHPWQLRLAALLAILLSPLAICWSICEIVWEQRGDILAAYRKPWGYVIKGGE